MRGTLGRYQWVLIWLSVHPRACGELPEERHWSDPRGRFIPAHAGNSFAGVAIRHSGPVHPRACGELGDGGLTATYRSRFIPAHAGNSHAPSKWWLWLHGSSPRMRGTQHKVLHRNAGPRFIPAHAGNSGQPTHDQRSLTVHPRACGELLSDKEPHTIESGSSPRMRGTHLKCGGSTARIRFIPAHAGNSAAITEFMRRVPVHPRACGELHRNRRPPRYYGRFIPAHAGNSIEIDVLPGITDGSSPRMRGTP